MVCVAAFIILCLVGVFVAILSIFRRDIGAKYWQIFKKAWGCVWKKVRLQKCETNFKDDVKNTLLKKVVLKKPHLVQPLSVAIEVFSVLIVFTTIWSLTESAKAGLALWTFGTCNVSRPASCSLGAEACAIDAEEPKNPIESFGQWFSEWGEIFSAIPDRLKSWDAKALTPQPYFTYGKIDEQKPYALDIFDPGCIVCLQSYNNQLSDHFVDRYNVILLPYAIPLPDNSGYKYPNSRLIINYLYATPLLLDYDKEDITKYNTAPLSKVDQQILREISPSTKIINRLFTEFDEKHTIYQSSFQSLDQNTAEQKLQAWLMEWGLAPSVVESITKVAHSRATEEYANKVNDIVKNKLHSKSIPITIYDNRKHTSRYE